MTYKQRYEEAYYAYFNNKYAASMATGYFRPKMPKVSSANGLTNFILNYITWTGGYANRISSAGRFIRSANKFDGGSFIPSTTKKGSADIRSIVKGISIDWEVKIGNDKASAAQIEQQAAVHAAGGHYCFVGTPDRFFEIYDTLLQK